MTQGQADPKLIQLLIPGEKVLDINKGYIHGQCVAQRGLMLFGSRPGQQPRLGCPMGEERTQMSISPLLSNCWVLGSAEGSDLSPLLMCMNWKKRVMLFLFKARAQNYLAKCALMNDRLWPISEATLSPMKRLRKEVERVGVQNFFLDYGPRPKCMEIN